MFILLIRVLTSLQHLSDGAFQSPSRGFLECGQGSAVFDESVDEHAPGFLSLVASHL